MASAKNKLKEYLLDHVGEDISREVLREVSGGIYDWQRSLRALRQESGLDIESTNIGYKLNSDKPSNIPKTRKNINNKLRYAVLQRDNSTCQRCGANIYNTKDVKLVVDHKLPVDICGETVIDNLWTLCESCNGGKQAFFSDDNMDKIKEIMSLSSAAKRLEAYFKMHPNKVIEPIKLQTIANVRDWERALRSIRSSSNMNIRWIRASKDLPMGGYIYKT